MTSKKKTQVLFKQTAASIAALIIGLSVVVVSHNLSLALSLVAFLSGVAIAIAGLVNVFLVYPKLCKVEKLAADDSGLAWIWIVAALSILFCPFVYWVIGVPYSYVIDTVTSSYSFTGVIASVFTFMRVMISYLLTFALLGILFWAVVQSKAQGLGGT